MSRKAYKSESGREIHHPETVNEKDEEEDESDDEKDSDLLDSLGNKAVGIGVGLFLLAAIFIIIAMTTSYWIQSDRVNTYGSARFERMGLWTHCLRTLADPFDPYARRFTAGCKIILGLFSTEATEKRLAGLPAFFVAVQFMYTLCFIFTLVVCIMLPVYLMTTCLSGPYNKRYLLIIKLIGHFTVFAGFVGLISVIVFAAKANSDTHPDLQNHLNFLSWSYYFALVGVILELISGFCFEIEGVIQTRNRG